MLVNSVLTISRKVQNRISVEPQDTLQQCITPSYYNNGPQKSKLKITEKKISDLEQETNLHLTPYAPLHCFIM